MGVNQSSFPRPGSPKAECPVAQDVRNGSNCPVPDGRKCRSPIYNVYSQRIDENPRGAEQQAAFIFDPRNNMPLAPNQQPFPGQRVLLATERVKSSIPKGGTDATWEYPSPQMFYNGAPNHLCGRASFSSTVLLPDRAVCSQL